MTSYGPSPRNYSLLERLVGADLVVVGRVREMVKRWPDPCAAESREFALVDVEVRTTLHGKADDRIQVRVAGSRNGEALSWPAPLDDGEELLLVLARDGDGDPTRFALQHESGFRVVDEVVEIPADVNLGEYATDEGGRLKLGDVAQMLADLEESAAKRWSRLDATEGEGWRDNPYPEVLEVPSSEQAEEEQAKERDLGPREAKPGTAWRPRSDDESGDY